MGFDCIVRYQYFLHLALHGPEVLNYVLGKNALLITLSGISNKNQPLFQSQTMVFADLFIIFFSSKKAPDIP